MSNVSDFTLFAIDAGLRRKQNRDNAVDFISEQWDEYLNSLAADEVSPQELERAETHKTVWQDEALALWDATDKTRRERKAAKAAKVLADAAKPVSGGSVQGSSIQRLSDVVGQAYDRYIFTVAQNNTHTYDAFLDSIKNYCSSMDARLVVGRCVYNKNGFQNGVKDAIDGGAWYDPALGEYTVDVDCEVFPGLVWLGSANVLPTAKNPLAGFESVTAHDVSVIVPHVQIAAAVNPAFKGASPKWMYATGAITVRNYIQKKLGQVAERAHKHAALLVEYSHDTGLWFARQIEADDNGGFQDLGVYWCGANAPEQRRIDALHLGDIHAEKLDQKIADVSWRLDYSIARELRPTVTLVHDLLDFTARNHHNIRSGHFRFDKHVEGMESVSDDLYKAWQVLSELQYVTKPIVVESNHDLALTRWLDDTIDFKQDPVNAITYLECSLALYEAMKRRDSSFNMLEWALNKYGAYSLDNCEFLQTDQSYRIHGIECGCHGHNGINGARGNPAGFRKLGFPLNTGHTHTPGIYGDVYVAGVTGSKEMGYNTGFSSWDHAHVIIYKNGKRALIGIKFDANGDAHWHA